MPETTPTKTVAELPVFDTIIAAWHKTYGVKSTFWAALAIMIIVLVSFLILQTIGEKIHPAIGMGISIIGNILNLLLTAGTIYMGIRHAQGAPISYEMVFRAFRLDLTLKLLGVYILQTIIIGLIFVAALIIGTIPYLMSIMLIIATLATIFVIFRMILAIPLVIDQEVDPWSAIKMSFEGTRHNFWRILGFYFLSICVFFVSMLPLGIGLIWSLPMLLIAYGIVYQVLRVNIRTQ